MHRTLKNVNGAFREMYMIKLAKLHVNMGLIEINSKIPVKYKRTGILP